MVIYVLVIVVIAFVVHTNYNGLYRYAAVGLIAVNFFMHFMVKCTLDAPRLRAAFNRAMLEARRAALVGKP